MELNTFYDLESLITYANQQLDQYDTISFDLFETIFIQRIPSSNMIKAPVSRYIVAEAERLGINVGVKQVSDLRNMTEASHRTKNDQKHPGSKINYDVFMQETLKKIFGDQLPDDLFKRVVDYEVDMICAMTVVRSVLCEWIKSLHLLGKRVFLISDNYLSSTYLKRIVKKKGLLEYVEDVISSIDMVNSGDLNDAFPIIQDHYELNSSHWLHIGSNPNTEQTTKQGIATFAIRDVGEHHRISLAKRYQFYATQRDFWKGRNVYQGMLPLEAENIDRDPLYTDGFGFLGFLTSYFIHRLIERCKDKNIKRVYFCSREGWMFQRVWEELAPWFYPTGEIPEVSYLYVSRMGLASPACAYNGLTQVNAQVARFPAGNRDFHDLCRIFKLDDEALEPYLQRYGINTESPIGMNSADYDKDADIAFKNVLKDHEFQEAVKAQAMENNEALQRYLEQEGFFDHEEVAIVDIGWLGTIQHYLIEAVGHRPDMPRVYGFTLGAIRLVPYHDDWFSRQEGLVHDAYRPSFFTSMTDMIKPVLEEVFRAPHPTLLGYELEDNKPKLQFRTTDDIVGQGEISQNEYYKPLHQGIVDAAKRYGPAVQLAGYNTNQLKPWLNFMYLARIAFPKAVEVQRLKHQEHQDDFFGSKAPSRKSIAQDETLWTSSDWSLRFNPFLRTRWLLKYKQRFLQR